MPRCLVGLIPASVLLLGLLPSFAHSAAPPRFPRAQVGKRFRPFDLTYLPRVDRRGLAGFRPAEIARIAPTDKFDVLTMLLGTTLQALGGGGLAPTESLPFRDIEEIVCGVTLQATFSVKGKQDSLMAGLGTPFVIRMNRPFDWAGTVKRWCPAAVKGRRAGRDYWKVHINLRPIPEGDFGFFIPDDRTLVVSSEEDVRHLISRLKAGKPAPVPPPGWKEVHRDLIALAIDNRKGDCFKGEWPEGPPELRAVRALVENTGVVALGALVGERTTLRLVVTARDDASARNVFRAVTWARAIAGMELAKLTEGDGPVGLVREAFESVKLSCVGRKVRAEGGAPVNVFQLAGQAMPAPAALPAPPVPDGPAAPFLPPPGYTLPPSGPLDPPPPPQVVPPPGAPVRR